MLISVKDSLSRLRLPYHGHAKIGVPAVSGAARWWYRGVDIQLQPPIQSSHPSQAIVSTLYEINGLEYQLRVIASALHVIEYFKGTKTLSVMAY